jgi:hypothetical protein
MAPEYPNGISRASAKVAPRASPFPADHPNPLNRARRVLCAILIATGHSAHIEFALLDFSPWPSSRLITTSAPCVRRSEKLFGGQQVFEASQARLIAFLLCQIPVPRLGGVPAPFGSMTSGLRCHQPKPPSD